MTTIQLSLVKPLEAPLPPQRGGDALTESQWTTLLAVADTIVPSIVASTQSQAQLALTDTGFEDARETIIRRGTGRDLDLPVQYLEEKPSSVPAFRALLQRNLSDYLREDVIKGLRVILSALE